MSTNAQHIGFIGTGIMGKPMARNLMRAGYRVHVQNRTAVRYADLVAQGATAHETPAALAAVCDVVITMVTGAAETDAVLYGANGANGAIAAMSPGSLLIDMGTTSPERARALSRACAERGIEALDAPVSGGENGAIAGTLTIMVGGSAVAFARAEPILRGMGTNVTLIGDAGAGQTAKACNQLIVVATIEAVAEAMALAAGSGLDQARVRAALMGGSATSRILDVHGQRIVDPNFEPGGMVKLHLKDRDNVNDSAARAKLDLPLANLVFGRVQQMVDDGNGDRDHSALYTLLERTE